MSWHEFLSLYLDFPFTELNSFGPNFDRERMFLFGKTKTTLWLPNSNSGFCAMSIIICAVRHIHTGVDRCHQITCTSICCFWVNSIHWNTYIAAGSAWVLKCIDFNNNDTQQCVLILHAASKMAIVWGTSTIHISHTNVTKMWNFVVWQSAFDIVCVVYIKYVESSNLQIFSFTYT